MDTYTCTPSSYWSAEVRQSRMLIGQLSVSRESRLVRKG